MPTPSATNSDLIVTGFHALSDPIRIGVLELLKKREQCVCDLCDALGVNQSKLSFHLKTLKETRLVNARQEGRWIYYSLNLPQFKILESYLAEFSHNQIIPSARICCDEE
ncbi:metalloregulator ArsR/SmtB family transcription factor [Nodularia harveyana UHCC-0300]|uniref:Metalloregulator ArsR/SmtB family transcription factor n=1 Tax=Nodularia harveyana UHCC-0300 TaxID=2974287 RepID=A0ABU5UFF0_9CYAN|nr:metalloregulator ArsR/SmtB family transcription factor [Nodularia harveyana]MEA5582229.1 metalloregulator ArsR/SmtB family transcription factor [Nodularia harveyana UHCC-0300]